VQEPRRERGMARSGQLFVWDLAALGIFEDERFPNHVFGLNLGVEGLGLVVINNDKKVRTSGIC
jgi:hypothetical protein